jgi:hypothetical protein
MKGIFGSTNKQKVCLPVKGFPGGGGNAQKSPYFEAIKNYKLKYLDNEFVEVARTTWDSKINK